jgi:alanyl aminopeptidase
VEPQRYDLAFVIDPTKDRFSARTTIDVKLSAPTRFVHLHARELEFAEVSAEFDGGRVTPTLVFGENSGLALDLGREASGSVKLHFAHSAALDEVPMSLYRAKDGERWYAFTQFEALAAREAFPCFDEPRFKTPFAIRVTVPTGMMALSNAPQESEKAESGATTHAFRVTRPLPTYLVALAVGDFDLVEADQNLTSGVPFRIVTTHGKSQHTRFALEQTPRILSSLVSYFGSGYPYQKLDMVAVPSFRAGAMENAGLVTYRERYLILDAERVDPQDKLRAKSIIAHELAHMWFGNLVTMQWWDDLWLNEAFATWMAGKVMEKVSPEAEPELMAVRGMVRVMDRDALPSSTPIRKTIRDEGDIQNAFDPITYQKGEAVLRMLELWTGPEKFRDGIRAYLERHAWHNATMST